MRHAIEVVKVMEPFPHTVESGTTLKEARQLIAKYTAPFLPVTRETQPIGIVTVTDIDRALKSCPAEQQATIAIRDLKLAKPYVVESNEHLATVLSTMLKEHLEAAVVVRKGRVVGTFSYTGAYRLLLKFLSGTFSLSDPPDITA